MSWDFCRRVLGAFEMTNREFSLKMSLIQRGLWLSRAVMTRIAVGCASPDQVRGNVEFRGCSFGSFSLETSGTWEAMRLCDVKVPLELWQKAQASGLLPQHLHISE